MYINSNILRLVFTCIFVFISCITNAQSNNTFVIRSSTNTYSYNYLQTPDDLEVIGGNIGGYNYQWEQSLKPLSDFVAINAASNATYTNPNALTQTTYFRCVVTNSSNVSFYTNIIQIEIVSIGWEDYNYTRVHSINVPGITDWITIDNLPIGIDGKFQSTNYTDGLGRTIQNVSKGTATNLNGSTTWGDKVEFKYYDNFGRQTKSYLPYTTTSELGKHKTDVLTEQSNYYTNTLNESSPYSEVTQFDNSPLNRARTVKSPGFAWAAATGIKKDFELNTIADEVHIWKVSDYSVKYSVPDGSALYPASVLFKIINKDENDKEVIEFINKSGQLIFKKVQLNDNPSSPYEGWICTYYVYDDFGRLYCTIEPEAVNKCYVNGNWTFFNNYDLLTGYCYFYAYDEKGRMVGKRPPGASELKMIYDPRDRLVFTQDGNQNSIGQWTATLYDELDRMIITTLYNSYESETTLQANINAASSNSNVSIINPGQIISDLVVDNRIAGIPSYKATHSVELLSTASTNFESLTNDEFTVEIDANTIGPNSVSNTTIHNSPISTVKLNNPSICTILKYQFYDTYSFEGAQNFDNNFNNTQAYSTNGLTIKQIAKSARTLSFPTGNKTRVLNTNTFIDETVYYDEDGQIIQSLKTNIKDGKDIITFQYHYDGRLLSSFSKHSTLGTGYVNFGILTKNIFDKIGRTISSTKKLGTNDFITIANFEYDDIGRLKSKLLSPNYQNNTTGGTGLEKLNYSYNIHGKLSAINKDYALKTSNFDKWSHYFGLYLGYDNSAGLFNNSNLNGQLTGTLWTTQGDDAQRKYDFTYDNAGRLTKADFKQRETIGNNWDNTKLDFTVKGLPITNNLIEYDLNGNLKNMVQRGVVIGSTSPLDIDKLTYTYYEQSNHLKKVTDDSNAGQANGTQGDFKSGTHTGLYDYEFDANGNTIIDRNKNIEGYVVGDIWYNDGIKYNFLDKPERVLITGKGVVKYVYDANGDKLQKIFTLEGSTISKITTYINQYTYEETKSIASSALAALGGGGFLQAINFEEGRIRTVQQVSQANGLDALVINGSLILPDGKKGVVDYFIKDHLASVRMVLTQEEHQSIGTCTLEDNRTNIEQPVFGNPTKFATASIPGQSINNGWQNQNIGNYVSRLSKLTNTVGASALLKVMAGDELTALTDYYYQNPVTNTAGNSNLANNVLSNLYTAITGSIIVSSSVKNAASNIVTANSSTTIGNMAAPDANNSLGTAPKAYITILFFDERFNYVGDGSTFERARQSDAGNHNPSPLLLQEIKAPKNGYAFVYVSNESNEFVYFDNLKIKHTRGRILEENHYYAFGLKIAGISSNKMGDALEGKLSNESKYQGEFSDFEEELSWNDFELRTYDPQIGRWLQQDPYEEFSSPYVGMGNDPVNNVDPDGGGIFDWLINIFKDGSIACPTVNGVAKAATGISTNIAISIVVNLTNQVVAKQVGDLNEKITKNQLENGSFKNKGGTPVKIPKPPQLPILRVDKTFVNKHIFTKRFSTKGSRVKRYAVKVYGSASDMSSEPATRMDDGYDWHIISINLSDITDPFDLFLLGGEGKNVMNQLKEVSEEKFLEFEKKYSDIKTDEYKEKRTHKNNQDLTPNAKPNTTIKQVFLDRNRKKYKPNQGENPYQIKDGNKSTTPDTLIFEKKQ